MSAFWGLYLQSLAFNAIEIGILMSLLQVMRIFAPNCVICHLGPQVRRVLHAATFGAYHAIAVTLVHRYFGGKHQARGQGIYNRMAFGAGGTLCGSVSRAAWDSLGPQATFMIAAGFALLGFILVVWKRKALEA